MQKKLLLTAIFFFSTPYTSTYEAIHQSTSYQQTSHKQTEYPMQNTVKFKAVIFDMDGTIVDTEWLWKEADKYMLEKRDIPVTQSLEKKLQEELIGCTLRESCERLRHMMQLADSIDTLCHEKRTHVCELYQKGVCFIDGFSTFHKKALTYNLKTGLATNTDGTILAFIKKALKLETFFGTHIYDPSHVNYKAKPHPDIYLHAAQQLGVEPCECIVIEDSAFGIQAARDAGMFCIGINTAKTPELLRQAHIIINHYDEIQLEKLLGT